MGFNSGFKGLTGWYPYYYAAAVVLFALVTLFVYSLFEDALNVLECML